MAISDGLVAILVLGFWLFCLFDVITTDEAAMRNLGKVWWVLIVLFLVVIGSIMWLVAGRPQGAGTASTPYRGNRGDVRAGGRSIGFGGTAPAGRTLAPDDDPEFLESVRMQNAEDRDLLRRWEEDLRRREDELRRNDTTDPDAPAPSAD